MTAANTYVMADVDALTEMRRLEMLELWNDPGTTRRLNQLGVTNGWRCLEVGPGRGSITRWLANTVGATGSVVAADIDPRFLTQMPSNVEVQKLDIREHDLEPAHYDLVHSRFVLMHLPDPATALTRMITALRPGGLLLAEEGDYGLLHFAADPSAAALNDANEQSSKAMRHARIMDAYLGRRLPGMLLDHGLELQHAEIDARITQPGDLEHEWTRITWLETLETLVAMGVSDETHRALTKSFFASTATVITTLAVVAATGRKPS